MAADERLPPEKVLVIEDDAELRELHQRRFETLWDADVDLAGYGHSGLDQVDAAHDLVVLDWRLPDADGEEMLEELSSAAPDVPVVVSTGMERGVDSAELSCLACLEKPSTLDDWRNVVEDLDDGSG